jgi:hypothetical protein
LTNSFFLINFRLVNRIFEDFYKKDFHNLEGIMGKKCYFCCSSYHLIKFYIQDSNLFLLKRRRPNWELSRSLCKNVRYNVRNLLFCVLLLSFFAFILDCERDFSNLINDPFAALKPTSHNFNWKIDTLSFSGAIQIIPQGIWGSDTNDAWMVGHSDDYRAGIWHISGKKWEPMPTAGLGLSPKEIIGFSNDNIWVVGVLRNLQYPVEIVRRWDGIQWNEFDTGISNEYCFSIWGTSSRDLYFGYDEGLIAHFDGVRITRYYTGSDAHMLKIFGFSSDDIYACGVKIDQEQPHDSTYYYLYHFNGYEWTVLNYHILTVHSGYFNFPSSDLWGNYRHLLFGVNGLYVSQYLGSSKWKPMFEAERSVWYLHGTDINNIFITGSGGSSIYHFNGSTWVNFDQLNTLDFWGRCVFTIKSRVFIGGINSYDMNAYIIQGNRK